MGGAAGEVAKRSPSLVPEMLVGEITVEEMVSGETVEDIRIVETEEEVVVGTATDVATIVVVVVLLEMIIIRVDQTPMTRGKSNSDYRTSESLFNFSSIL